MKVSVIGLGKAGLPLAAVMVKNGIPVVGIDVSKDLVNQINSGGNPIPEEDGLGDILSQYGGNLLKAYTDYSYAKECNIYVVIVPLFIDSETKKTDFSILKNAFKNIAEILDDGDLVILETTMPPGSTEKVLKPILDESKKDYKLAYSPERIMTGFSISRFDDYPKVIGGISVESSNKACELYSKFAKEVHIVENIATAEMIKVAEGTYRDVNIALSNEIFKICESLSIDYQTVKRETTHDVCNLHNPGNVGGHCIPVYPWFLINGFGADLLRVARSVNDNMISYYADKLEVKSGKIAVLGLTYRDNVKELAYTRSIPMVNLLKSRGFDVFVNDPLFSKFEIEKMGLKYVDNFAEMDGIILMNKCEKYSKVLYPLIDRVVDVHGVLSEK